MGFRAVWESLVILQHGLGLGAFGPGLGVFSSPGAWRVDGGLGAGFSSCGGFGGWFEGRLQSL